MPGAGPIRLAPYCCIAVAEVQLQASALDKDYGIAHLLKQGLKTPPAEQLGCGLQRHRAARRQGNVIHFPIAAVVGSGMPLTLTPAFGSSTAPFTVA